MKKLIFSLFAFILFTVSAYAQGWTVIPSASVCTFSSCSFGSNSTVYVVGSWGSDTCIIEKSTNAGLSFVHLDASFLPAGSVLKSVCFTSADTGCIAGGIYSATGTPAFGNGFIYRTTNGGASWTPVVTGAPTIFTNICFPSVNIGYACGSYIGVNAIVYKTTDGGATWTSIYTSVLPITISRIDMIDDNTGHISGQHATTSYGALINISGGVVTGTSSFPAYNSFGAIHFTSATTGFVTANSGGGTGSPAFYILKTTDGGSTWAPVYTTGYDYETCLKFDGLYAFAIGGNGLESNDGGATWSTMGIVATGFGSTFYMDIKNHVRLIVGESGLIARQVGPTAVPELTSAGKEFELYPNPASSETNLIFKEPQSNTLVCIADVTGRTIKQLVVNGTHSTISTHGMHKGLYVLSISGAYGDCFAKLSVE